MKQADDELTFAELNFENVARCGEAFHPLEDWTPMEWAVCLAGEVGEACNLIKKVRRGEVVSVYDIGDELADVVIYVDLLCERMGLSLEEHIIKKFNEVSDRVGSERKL